MFTFLGGSYLVVIVILALCTLLGKIWRGIERIGEKPYKPYYGPYGENSELYHEPLHLLSKNNKASKITRKDGLFYVTIENTITGDKQTLSDKDKWDLCMKAEEVATKFALKERDEYHTTQDNKYETEA